LCCLLSAFLGAAGATLYCAKVSRATLEAVAASQQAEREDWQRREQALAARLDAEHFRLVDSERADRALASVAVGEHNQLAAARQSGAAAIEACQSIAASAVNSATPQSAVAAAPAAADPSSLLPGILGLAAKLLFRK
jgi:L-amino acid N-acyltransferase YncA